MQRAQANEKRLRDPAMRGTELRTRAGVGYAIAKGAQGYYSGSMPRRKATFSPLTRSMDKKALAARRKQVVDNNKPQKGGAAKQQAAKAAAKKAAKATAASLSRARPGQEQRAMQRVGGAGTVLQRRDNAEAQRVAASGGRRTSRKEAINRRMYNSITTAIRARYAIDNPGKQRRYSTVKNPGPAGVSALTTKAPRLTAKASQPSPQTRAKRPASTVRKPSGLRPGALAATKPAAKKAAKGPKVKLPRMATPTGVIRGSDRAKVKADARKGIGTPYSRAQQRAFARSAREAPLQRKQAIAAAKRKGRTGFGKGPQMNAGSIGNRDFAWNKNETPATARERLAMWRKSEQRRRGNARRGSIGVKGAAGALRASRRAAALVDSGNRLGNLPTTRKMAEEPRQRRNDRISRNETQGRLASSEASRRLLPQIQKVRDAAQKRIAEGKKPTAAQKEKERKLVGEYNKAVRKLQVAEAAKSYTQNPYGFKPQRMSGAVKAAKKPTAPKRTRSARPAGTVAKPRGLKPGALAARRGAKAAKLTGKGKAPVSRLVKPVKQADGSFDVNGRPAKTMQDAMRVLRQQRAQEKERALSAKRISATKRVDRADLQAVEKGKGKRANNPYARENAIFRFSQKETQVSNRADKVANQGRALEAEYTKLTRKPATKANEKRIQQLRSQINRLRRSFETLLKASKSYNQRGLAVRRPFPRIYR